MKTYAELVQFFNSFEPPHHNPLLCAYIEEVDKETLSSLKALCEKEDKPPVIYTYYQQFVTMSSELSVLCYAAANGYAEFYEAFDALPEDEKTNALQANNGGLALLFSTYYEKPAVLQILLKQKFIQALLNKPYRRETLRKTKLEIDYAVKLPSLDGFPSPSEAVYSYGQLAMLYALKKNKECFQLLHPLIESDPTLMVQPKKSKKKQQKSVVDKLNFVCQHQLQHTKEHKHTWQFSPHQKSAFLTCSSEAHYHYLSHYFKEFAKRTGYEIGSGIIMAINDKNETIHHQPTLYLDNVCHSTLNEIIVIPAITKLVFSDKKLLEFSSSLKTEPFKEPLIRPKNKPICYLDSLCYYLVSEERNGQKSFILKPHVDDETQTLDTTLFMIMAKKKPQVELHQDATLSSVSTPEVKRESSLALTPSEDKSSINTKTAQARKNVALRKTKVAQGGSLGHDEIKISDMTNLTALLSQVMFKPQRPELSEDEIKTRRAEKDKAELENDKNAIKDEIYFYPSKRDNYTDEKYKRMQDLNTKIEKHALAINLILEDLSQINQEKKTGVESDPLKRNTDKLNEKTIQSKKTRVEQYLKECNDLFVKLKKIDSDCDMLFKLTHIKILELCDTNELTKAQAMMLKLKKIFIDFDNAHQDLLRIENALEQMKNDLAEQLARQEHVKSKFQEMQKQQAEYQARQADLKLEAERKETLEQKKQEELAQTALVEKLKKREKWFSEQAAYEEKKAAETKLSKQQLEEQNSIYSPLYSRKSFRFFRRNPSANLSKEPKPISLNMKGGNIEYRTRLVKELNNVEQVLKLILASKSDGPLPLNRYAIRGALARVFEIIRHLQGHILTEKEAYALRLYLFKGPEFDAKESSDAGLVDLSLKLVQHCRRLSQKNLFRFLPYAQGLLKISDSFVCDAYQTLTTKAVQFMQQSQFHRENAPELSELLLAIQVGKNAVNEIAMLPPSDLNQYARIFVIANLGYHSSLLQKHYRSIFNRGTDKKQLEFYIAKGNAIRHEDTLVTNLGFK